MFLTPVGSYRKHALLALWLALCLVGPALAQSFALPPMAPSPLDEPTTSLGTYRVSRIAFRGNTVLPLTDLQQVVAPYVGKTLDASDIEDVRLRVSRLLFERGYINSGAVLRAGALVPETPGSADHVLNLDIIDGHITDIRVRGMQRLQESYLLGRLLPDASAPFNAEALRERYLLALDDPLFERLEARLLPGQALGQAQLEIDVTRAPSLELTALANNYRPSSIGANARGLKATVRNLTGLGDALTLGQQAALSNGDAPRQTLAWQVPLDTSGMALHLQAEQGRSTVIEEPARDLDIRSALSAVEWGVSKVLTQSLSTKLTTGLSWGRRISKTTLLGEPFSFVPNEPTGTTRVQTGRWWQELGWRTASQAFAMRSTFSQSRNNLQTSADLPPTNTPLPARSSLFWLGQVQAEQQIDEDKTRLRLRSVVQTTRDVLLPLDRLPVGGVGTVRGYRENQLMRDTGAVVNLELVYKVWSDPVFQVDLMPFFDIGRARNIGEPSTNLESRGLAVTLRWQGLRLEVARGIRQRPVPGALATHSGLQERGIHVQLSLEMRAF